MKKLIICAFALAVTVSMAVAGDYGRSSKGLVPVEPMIPVANCLSYDYVDLQYSSFDYGSAFLLDGSGYGIAFSKSIGSTLFVTGGYQHGNYTYDWVDHLTDVETSRYRLGLGARHTVAKCFDLTFEAGGQHMDSEYEPVYSDHDYDSWGYYFGPGFRTMVGKWEFFANAFYSKHEGDFREEYLSHQTPIYDRVDDYTWRFNPGIIYHFTENLGVKVAAEFDRQDTEWIFGVRFNY